jgi:hypothetical protein
MTGRTTALGRIGFVAASLALVTTAGAALAGPGSSLTETTFQPRNQQTMFIQRYPGDQAIEGGTVRVHGPDKGPYIERCYWTASEGLFGFLPFGLTQRCYRHTLENTPE